MSIYARLTFICIALLFLYISYDSFLFAQSNNKVGVHIFDPNEVEKVPDLVNSSGGDWGYVTVPLRSDDRDRAKWQRFMDMCREKHIIPIIRLATTIESNYWAKPGMYDYIDFANFLSDLDWPIKQRYVIVYNEPNHATEWGGSVNPNQYAHELNRTITIFKERNPDYFMLPAGLDAAAPNTPGYMNWRRYMMAMWNATNDSLKNIDGWNSHSYPNPGFSGSPNDRHDHSIRSFQYEMQLYKSLTGKSIPIFITETGWSNELVSNNNIANYLKQAFSTVWNSDDVIAVTPFVLQAGAGPFVPFSLLDGGGNPKPQYQALKWLSKTKGEPEINQASKTAVPVLGIQSIQSPATQSSQPKLINSSQSPFYDIEQLINKWLKRQ